MGQEKNWNHHENKFFVKTKNELDAQGCGFCLAKWTQVTLQLQTGHTHSCHHPKTHKIPTSEIVRNPSALHNTRFKKKRRKEMLEGGRPAECDYCWNVEDNSDQFSDRVFKSNESWSKPHMDEIKQSDWRADFNPRYVEVAFSAACNFKCSYCGPAYSTTWQEEIEQYGAYPTSDKFNDPERAIEEDKVPFKQRDHNPYVEAFWRWWPDLYRDLHTFRITGGEPLLSKDTWKVLDFIIKEPNPNKNLQLAINSNLGVPDKLIDRFIDKINKICDEDRVKEFIIFTSVDTWGEQAAYIRTGMVFNRFWDNLHKILEKCPRVNVTVMSTYNCLSIPNYDKLIDGIYDLKNTYGTTDRYWASAVFLDSSYLRYPWHQSVQLLQDQKWKNMVLEQAKLMFFQGVPIFDHNYIGYSDIEIQKVKRIYDWMNAEVDPKHLKSSMQNFYRYFNAHDERRGTNFLKTFPELADFHQKCKSLC